MRRRRWRQMMSVRVRVRFEYNKRDDGRETIVVGHINYFILNRYIINIIYIVYIIILYYYTDIVRVPLIRWYNILYYIPTFTYLTVATCTFCCFYYTRSQVFFFASSVHQLLYEPYNMARNVSSSSYTGWVSHDCLYGIILPHGNNATRAVFFCSGLIPCLWV